MNKLLLLLIVPILLISCTSHTEEKNTEKFFSGLTYYEEDNTEKAVSTFTKVAKKENSTSALFAIQALLPLLFEQNNYEEIFNLTQSQLQNNEEEQKKEYSVDKNLLIRYKILSSIKLEKKDTIMYIKEWIEKNAFSKNHYQFFTSDEFTVFSKKLDKKLIDIIQIKIAAFRQDYKTAAKIIESQTKLSNDELSFFSDLDHYAFSDIGKSLLYGSEEKLYFAELFERAADTYPQKSTEAFMCYFYAGRLYEKTSITYRNLAILQFEKAIQAATNKSHYDNALWYYLSTLRTHSSRSCISELQKYAPLWTDSYYFDDLLDTLAYQLVNLKNYKGFYALYNGIKAYMSPVSLSKYAYMSALFIKEGYLNTEFSLPSEKEHKVTALLEQAFNAKNGNLYYRIMAAYELKIPTEKALLSFFEKTNTEEKIIDSSFYYILQNLLKKGYTDEFYSLFLENSIYLNNDMSFNLIHDFSKVNTPTIESNYKDNLYPEALRMAAKIASSTQEDLTIEEVKYLYPTFYDSYVNQVADVHLLEKHIIYAIIRSESFFDHDVKSWAGAIGLTQLMPTTAGDVARKLKVNSYNLTNPGQNIDFGMYYFDELLPRFGVDNSVLRALFAYNAGITNIRRWEKAYSSINDNPPLFLETIPFAETREYGRKVLSAGVLYALLYNDYSLEKAVESIMN